MFTKLANEIDFNDIEAFCREWGEGVRVEYKSNIANVPKIISSFANTQGGIFIIGVETDENSRAKLDIQGIPNEGGIREQIEQSATDGIYPPIMPEVIICDVPGEKDKVVIVVRVEESQHAPHAIQNSTKVYVRQGSTTPPYELAEIGRIEYLLKRREEPQRISRRILDRIEERVRNHCSHQGLPNLELLARPVFPYRPLISPLEIYEFMRVHPLIPFTEAISDFGTRKVTGGVCYIQRRYPPDFWELNEYGIMYHRTALSREPFHGTQGLGDGDIDEEKYLDSEDIGRNIYVFLGNAKDFFQKCQYLGNVEITVKLREVLGEKLVFPDDLHPSFVEERQSVESEVAASCQCLPRDLRKADAYAKILIQLLGQLFWVFNVSDNEWRDAWRKYVADRVGR